MSVKDPRKVVRIANIDRSLLTADGATGAKLQFLMVEALNRIEGLSTPGHKAAWFMDRNATSFLDRQLLSAKNPYLGYSEKDGQRQTDFGGIPIMRMDALRVNEAAIS